MRGGVRMSVRNDLFLIGLVAIVVTGALLLMLSPKLVLALKLK